MDDTQQQAETEPMFLGIRHSFLAKIPLALFFGLLAALQLSHLSHAITNWSAAERDFNTLHLLAVAVGFLFSLLIVATTCFRLKPVRKAQGAQPRLFALTGSFLSMSLPLLPAADLPPSLLVLSICMGLVGTSLSFWVLCWLGRSFSIMAEARRLVTSGPYAYVRHPLYVCEQLAILGVLLIHISPLAMGIVAIQWYSQLRRIRNEEQVLRASFPEYEAYAASTPRFFPFRLPGMRSVRRA